MVTQSIRCASTNPKAIRAAEAFPAKLFAVHGDRIKIRSTAVYWGNGTGPSSRGKGIDVRCSVCGHEWSPLPNHLLKGHGCPACANQNKVESAGKRRCPPATAAEKARAIELKSTGMALAAVAHQLLDEGLSPQIRGDATILRWTNLDQLEKQRQRSAKRRQDPEKWERDKANTRRWSKEFDHGKASHRTHAARRRKLKRGEREWLEDSGQWATILDAPKSFDDLNKEQQVYIECERLTKETGIKHHVDHIMPLSLGGDHVWWNLQILTAEENLGKNNKFRPQDQELYAQRLFYQAEEFFNVHNHLNVQVQVQ